MCFSAFAQVMSNMLLCFGYFLPNLRSSLVSSRTVIFVFMWGIAQLPKDRMWKAVPPVLTHSARLRDADVSFVVHTITLTRNTLT